MWGDTANPYWQAPENEEPRTQRVRAGVLRHVPQLSSVLFMVIKSWNDNVVLYEYDEVGKSAVKSTWLSLEPSDTARHLSMNNASLRSQLNPAEEMLFGCSVRVVEGGRFLVSINQEQLSSRVFELVMDSAGQPAVIGTVNGVMCRVEHAYVQMKKGFAPCPEYMNLYGRSMHDGSSVVERIVSKN
jgi:hypothetical protein